MSLDSNDRENDLGKGCYTLYGQSTNFLNYQGLPMPIWDDLPPHIQRAWINVATGKIRIEKTGEEWQFSSFSHIGNIKFLMVVITICMWAFIMFMWLYIEKGWGFQ